MPFVNTATLRVHYEIAGPADAPFLIFSNSLGTEWTMWNPQAEMFAQHFRVLRYDARGQIIDRRHGWVDAGAEARVAVRQTRFV